MKTKERIIVDLEELLEEMKEDGAGDISDATLFRAVVNIEATIDLLREDGEDI